MFHSRSTFCLLVHRSSLVVMAAILSICASPGISLYAQDNNAGVTIQLPVFGVSIDSEGVITTHVLHDPGGRLFAMRKNAAQKNLSVDVQKSSKLRFVSLRKLEASIKRKLQAGEPLDSEIKNLAGLQRFQFVFLVPDENDIYLAGPAEGWVDNLAGQSIGIRSGLPTMRLDDFLMALRIFPPNGNVKTWVGVSIDPTADGMQRLSEFNKSLPNRISDHQRDAITPGLVQRLRESLGLATIRSYGIPRTSHLAHVLIEADYRMKLIAVGIEPPPVKKLNTFIGELEGAPRGLQRWWLTPNYKCIRQSADNSSAEFLGRGVQLRTEVMFGAKKLPGKQTNGKKLKPSKAARSYASSFTKRYEEISAVQPAFAQLRNGIDGLILSAWILKNNGYQRSGWQPTLLLDEKNLAINNLPEMNHAQSVANGVWKGQILIMPAGGGVSIQASEALLEKNLAKDKAEKLMELRTKIKGPTDNRWWWD